MQRYEYLGNTADSLRERLYWQDWCTDFMGNIYMVFSFGDKIALHATYFLEDTFFKRTNSMNIMIEYNVNQSLPHRSCLLCTVMILAAI